MHEIFEQEVSVNVHFQPLPLFTVYKQLGYSIENYPVAYAKYASEISLPVYFQLRDDEVQLIIHAVKVAYTKVMG
jgi:dTDP-4-amino-4,6-dideoxygalactose transaminase